jgi:CRISPR/Cas system CSM-associated protein Csm4 (group 5 of RAMP superfamily)
VRELDQKLTSEALNLGENYKKLKKKKKKTGYRSIAYLAQLNDEDVQAISRTRCGFSAIHQAQTGWNSHNHKKKNLVHLKNLKGD